MDLSVELDASLREFSSAGPAELRENGSRIAPLSSLSWEVRGTAEKPLIHLWSEHHNLTRRVVAIVDHSEHRLALAVERFGRARHDRLEFIRLEFDRSARDLSRELFCQRTAALVADRFPDDRLESLTIAPDLEHSLSGNYARGVLLRGPLAWAFLAPADPVFADPVTTLTFALLWLDRIRLAPRRNVAGLCLLVPKGSGAPIAQLLPALDSRLPVEIWEVDPVLESVHRVVPSSVANISSWLVAHRETQSLLDQARPALDPLVAAFPALTLHPNVATREIALRLRGLPIARWRDFRILFGLAEPFLELTPATRIQFNQLLQYVETHRNPLASDTRHALYRAQAEKWLESSIREDITRIDPVLDPRFVYAQVTAAGGNEHGVLDLLSVNRQGRLAILELKAAEHIHLPLQAASYWLRIRLHQAAGSFSRYGYFPGVPLSEAPPLVYLVAPALRFHPSTEVLLRFLSPQLEVIRVGLAESWRRGLRVVMRQ